MTIRLLEIYRLTEDSRGKLKQLLKMHPKAADELHNVDPKNSFLLGKLYKERYMGAWDTKESDPFEFKAFGHSDDYEKKAVQRVKTWIIAGSGAKIIKALKDDQSLARKIKNKNFDDAMDVIDKVPSPEEIKKNKILDFSDGFYWLNLKTSECSIEARKMGHCGVDSDGLTMISLRDKSNNPHVTMSWDEGRNSITQIKGKQNSLPNRKYWNYIKELIDKKNMNVNDEDLEDGDHNDQEFLKTVDSGNNSVISVDAGVDGAWKMTGKDPNMVTSRAYIWELNNGEVEVSIGTNGDVWNIESHGDIPERKLHPAIEILLNKLWDEYDNLTLRPTDWESNDSSDEFEDFVNNIADNNGYQLNFS